MKFVRILFIIFILSILSLGGFFYWLYSSLHTPHQHARANQFIQIEKGSSPNQIINKLAAEGILANPLATQIYLRTFGDPGKLKAGDYQFKSPITPLEVLQELEKGEERTIKLTIPEGWTRFEIAKRLAEKFPTKPPMDEKAILYLMNDVSLIKDFDPLAKNLEGYLYPSTYYFPVGTDPGEAIKKMVEQFKKIWKPEWNQKARDLGRTPREIVIIASLIENESKFEQERPLVASVIYNRLSKGMPLGIDATNVYIAKMMNNWDGTLRKSHFEIDHPYNTRKITGLPPGPISSASLTAFEAALNPAKTNYIYYVLNVERNDGSHDFFVSDADFEKGKAKYQAWLAEQRRKENEMQK